MVDAEILTVTTVLLKSEEPEVREQSALLLGSFALSAIARQFFVYAFPNMKELLEDEVLAVRTATSCAFRQLSVNDAGCQRMIEQECAEAMIYSFIKRSNSDTVTKEDSQYLIHLLEAFVNLTFSDNGIEPLLGKDAILQFTKILDIDNGYDRILEEYHAKIAELCLRVLGNMSINHSGKQECIDYRVIEKSWIYLAPENESYEQALNTSLILMSCSIHLTGKNQIIDELDQDQNPLILQTIVRRLEAPDLDQGIRSNLKIVLTNVAELPRGFQDITFQLVEKIEILDEVFGPRAVKPLHNFLPKLTEYDKDLNMDDDRIEMGQRVIRALAVLFKKY